MLEIRTDLAIESKELYRETNKEEAPGVEVEKLEDEEYEITRVKILDEKGEESLGKPKGTYITIQVPKLKSADQDLKDKIITNIKERFGVTLEPEPQVFP